MVAGTAMVPVAREVDEPGVGALTRGGVAAAATVDTGEPAGADKMLTLPGKQQPFMMIFFCLIKECFPVDSSRFVVFVLFSHGLFSSFSSFRTSCIIPDQ